MVDEPRLRPQSLYGIAASDASGHCRNSCIAKRVSRFAQTWPYCSRYMHSQLTSKGENHVSKKATEHHKKAAEHLTHAARHHGEAAKHHEAGSHEKAAHHAHVARGHVIHARGHAEDAVKAHLEDHGKK
jgi:hypothetical protein